MLYMDLPLLDGFAFRYYLPAFVARAYETCNEDMVDYVVYSLDFRQVQYGLAGNLYSYDKIAKLQPFTPIQRMAIIEFLAWAKCEMNCDDAVEILASWSEVLPASS